MRDAEVQEQIPQLSSNLMQQHFGSRIAKKTVKEQISDKLTDIRNSAAAMKAMSAHLESVYKTTLTAMKIRRR
jgi:hypothetical protein